MITKHNVFSTVNNRNIYNALLSTLIHLKPKHCLEIGTFQGQSAEVFQYYFDHYQPDGLLVTIDIKLYQQLTYKNVKQKHSDTIWKGGVLPFVEDSVDKNTEIINDVFDGTFDFCFLDGDHQYVSADHDMQIATKLLKPPQYILFDDINDPQHECDKLYQELNFWVKK